MECPFDRAEKLFRITRVDIGVHLRQADLTGAGESYDQGLGIMRAEALDDRELVLLGNTVANNAQIELRTKAGFLPVMVTDGRNDGVSSAAKHQLTRAKQGFVVRDRKNASHASIPRRCSLPDLCCASYSAR